MRAVLDDGERAPLGLGTFGSGSSHRLGRRTGWRGAEVAFCYSGEVSNGESLFAWSQDPVMNSSRTGD